MKSSFSKSQLGVYYASMATDGNAKNYQIPFLYTLPEGTDMKRLRKAVYDALCAHPYLASHVVTGNDGQPLMESGSIPAIDECVPLLQIGSIDEVKSSFARTMDVTSKKLYRCELYQTAKGESYLYLDFHHLVADGYSVMVFVRETERCYKGEKALGEQMDGAAIAEAEEQQRADSALMDEAKEWYARTFCDAAETDSLPMPEMTLDAAATPVPRVVCFPLNVTKEEVTTIVERWDTKESTVMQAAWAQLLATYSAEDKASYCTIHSGRTDQRTEGSITMMIHTQPVFVQTKGDMPLGELFGMLTEQKEQLKRYQYYSYADALSDLGLSNQVLFAYQGKRLGEVIDLHLDGKTSVHKDLRQPIPGWKLCAELFEEAEGYALKLGYSSGDYSDAFIEQLAASYSAILHSMTTAQQVSELEYSTQEQKAWLNALNPTPKGAEGLPTLIERFKQHVAERPNDIFVVAGNKRLTYAEVDRLTDTIDPSYTVRCGEKVVGFSVPRDEKMVLAPISIAKAGLTQLPLDASYPEERLEYMKQDAAACQEDGVLVILYTSGTTGTPKGVMLTEDNFRIFEEFSTRHLGLGADSRYATYAGYGFDAFQFDLWGCVWAGATIYIIQDDIRFDLEGIYQYLTKEGITHCFMTTQMATQMVLNYPDIPGLKWLGTGGEKLMSLNPPTYQLLNAYGPTETTVYVCSHYVDKNEPNIPIGKPNDSVELYIVNRYGKQVPWGASGELIIAGPQVGMGYLNLPERTSSVFVDWNGKRVYRTGDIVRYRENGDIEFVGRKDGQVKIRGFRIELKEVEAVIRQFDGIKDATVQAFDYPQGGKYIAAYVVSDSPVDIEALNNFILDQKPPYMVPTATMQLDAIPLNQNQKVNRRALPEPVIGAVGEQQESAAPLNLLEEQLQKLVGTIVNTEEFGITTDLRYLGLTSILAIKLATQVFKQYGVQLDAKKLAKGGVTVQTIENEILRAILASPTAPKGASYAIVSPSGDERGALGAVPLSYAQAGVYFDSIKNPASTLYNTPICIAFPMETDSEALRQAVQKAVDNHPAMFVQFQTNGTGVVQVIGDRETPVDIPELTMSEEEARAYIQDFVQPFKLNKDRLFRFCIVRTPQAVYLYSDLHHLICDGYSYDLFIHELCDLLEGKEIEPELCSYAEFVFEQKAAEEGEAFAESAAFFKERLAGVESSTEVAADLSNPLPKGDNAKVACPIDWDKVTRLAQEQGVNPSAVMLSAVFYTLSRFAATDDVCITTISNGRSNLKVSNTMGMFVNTLALTTKIGTQSVSEFLRESGDTFEQTLAHENYPFSRIASDFGLNADIMFAYQMGVLSDYRVGGKAVKAEEIVLQNTPKFKIAFYVSDFDGEPTLSIEYDNGQYSADMMQNLAQSVCNAACAFAAAADAPLRSISLLNSAQSEVLDSFNQTEVPYDNTQTVVSLFRRQVEQHPDNIAMVYHDLRLTYKQVDEQSESIAQYVQSLGLGSEDVVSILIPRSEWMVVASLGVLKAGCAYQPLDPSYPAERLNFMMQDANAKLLIADEQLRPIVDEYQGKVLLTKDIAALPAAKAPVKADIKPSSLFILLYTSGSTGTPKGCQLEHGNLVAFCHWYHRYYELKPENKVAAYASYGFDACMMDMYSALTCGAAVYIIGEDIRLNLPQLNDYFNQEGITHSFMTTQVGCQFAANCDNHSLKHLSVGGEKILPLTPPTAYQLHNAYGPTECTIFTTTYQQKEFEQNAPIGKPLDNLKLFIVDKDQNRLPVGAAGELLVSGPQVSRGYLNLPEKTADTYIQWYGCRCYRTGDIVRYLADGNIQFVGRRDGQVKIRGFRIEMKEVEAVIREFPGIKDATVQAFDYETGGKYIAAYIVSDQQVDTKELNKFIASQKPPYMVPAATMQIDAIPLNQNQKVNRKALPAPVIQASDRDYVEPKNDQERLFAKIFGDILTMDKVSATDNFFELGGTSLMVTRVIIEADKANMHIAYGDVFSNPTPRQLAAFVSGATVPDGSPSASGNEITDFDYTAINNLLQKNTMATFQKGERQTLGDVLLTGATGYLGIHVLRELIDSDAKSIYCMVRGKDQQTAESRLKTLLYYYFSSSFKELFGQRLFVIQGDVTSFDDLPGIHIDTVFNCAANVKHFSRGTDIEDVNIGGAMSCVKFCLKTGARLVHVSTTSVGGLSVNGVPAPDVILTEKNLYFGQNLDNQYCYSKFMADRIILDAVALHGLNAKVMRVGNLAARSTDGEFQVNFQSNSYMGRIKVLNMLGCCPYSMYDDPAEFSPINETARAVVVLASTPKDCTVFHPYNNHIQLMGDILTQLGNITGGVRMVDDDEFERVLDEAKNDPTKAKQMSSMLAYQDMAHGQVAYEVGRDNQYTSQVLHRLGFYWSTTSWDYDQQMLQAIAGFGFFE